MTPIAPASGGCSAGALLFVLGFTALLVAEGALFGQLGRSIELHTLLIERILGAVTIVMGVVVPRRPRTSCNVMSSSTAYRAQASDRGACPRVHLRAGLDAPASPPTFSAIFGLVGVAGQGAGRGALLMAFYCLGLGIPFILVALSASAGYPVR